MNILFIVATTKLNGTEQLQLNLLKNLLRAGHKCRAVVLCNTANMEKWNIEDANYKITYLKAGNLAFGLFRLVFFMIQETERFDSIFSSQTLINATLGALKRIRLISRSTRLIFRESTNVFVRFSGLKLSVYRLAYKIGYKAAFKIVFQTNEMRQHFHSNVKGNLSTIFLRNPIDLDKLNADSNQPTDIEIDSKFIVSAGRLIREKGFDVLIKAFDQVKDRMPEMKLVILGEGPLWKEIQDQIVALGLTARVELAGYKTNPIPYYKMATICVVSSIIEGFPNVLLQMMAVNNNVISTLCAGGIEEIEGIQTCNVNDINGLAAKLLYVYEHPDKSGEFIHMPQLAKHTLSHYNHMIFETN